MEEKIKAVGKVMQVFMTVFLFGWSLLVNGVFSLPTLLLLVLAVFVVYNRSRGLADERDWQIFLVSTYVTFGLALCFFMVCMVYQHFNPFWLLIGPGHLFAGLLAAHIVTHVVFRKVLK
ncbi:MAG: hypothetical protein WCK76_08010 [Elusimicrobiota bacterium]